MFLRIVRESFFRQRRRKLIAISAVAIGTATATALASIALEVGDNVSRELRSFGANLTVLPAGGGRPVILSGEDLTSLRAPSYLDESDVLRVKRNFWKNNILDFAPSLDVPVTVDNQTSKVLMRGTWFDRTLVIEPEDPPVSTGSRNLHPFWSVRGDWPREVPDAASAGGNDRFEALAGTALAARLSIGPGSVVTVRSGPRQVILEITGILTAGGEEDGAFMTGLPAAQRIAGAEGKVDRVLVSALTTPENAVYERLAATHQEIPAAEFETWSCTPFVSSIAYEIGKAWPATEVAPIRRVADTEGKVLGKIGGLMGLIALIAAIGSALTVTSALSTSVLERRVEIGLLKALGSGTGGVLGLFLSEAILIGLSGGVLGGTLGLILARTIRQSVFDTPGELNPSTFFIAIVAALVITLVGSAVPARHISKLEPAEVLRG